MSTVSEISDALKNSLTTIQGLRVYDYLPDQINPPLAYVGIQTVNYHGAFRGGNPVHSYTVTVVIGRVNERTSQRALDEFLSYDGDRSVRAAIEADPTLDGWVQAVHVTDGGNLAPLTMGDVTYVSIDFTVTVYP
jgi:hypothetical protein